MLSKSRPDADRMPREAALALAEDVLLWLAAEPARLAAFLAATGLAPAALRDRAADPDLALAVLDHILGEETALLAACRALDLAPTAPARAARALGGGPAPHWT